MLVAILLFGFLWPFHHGKHNPSPAAKPQTTDSLVAPSVPTQKLEGEAVPEMPPQITEFCFGMPSGEVYYFGPDGTVGYGPDCATAWWKWNRVPAPAYIRRYTI